MKKIMTLAVTMLLSIAAYAADYGTYYQNMPVKMQQPEVAVIPDYSVNLKDFGAVGDGITLNTQAFDKAIKADKKAQKETQQAEKAQERLDDATDKRNR